MIAVTKGLVKHFYRLFSIVPATQHKNTPPERSVCRLIYVQLYLYLGTVPKGENHLLPAAYYDEIHHAVFKLRLADRD